MMRTPGPVRRRSERGAAAVEMAFVLPVLLLLVFGVIDFGRALNARIPLPGAARGGARAAVLNQAPNARAQKVASGLSGMTTGVAAIRPGSPNQDVTPAPPAPPCTNADSSTDVVVTTT